MLNKFVLGIFVDEIINQCDFALISWESLQTCLLRLEKPNYIRIFCHIQAFLVAVANISKILFPTDEKSTTRGEELRRLLQVRMNSPIEDRNIRNVFEHYDERIESWASSSKKNRRALNISDLNLSIGGFSAIPRLDPIECMRNLDVSRGRERLKLTFREETYNLTVAKDAVTELQERARKLRPSLF